MFIYSGWGILVVLLFFPAAFAAHTIKTSQHLSDDLFLILALSIWGTACLLIGLVIKKLHRDRIVIDKATNEELVIKNRSTLFWIPMEYWGLTGMALACLLIFTSWEDISTQFVTLARGAPVRSAQSQLSEDKASKESEAGSQVTAPVTPAPPAPTTPESRYQPGKIHVVFTNAVPGAYSNGRASMCTLTAKIANDTKFHLTKMTFRFENWKYRFEVGEMNAKTSYDDNDFAKVTLSDKMKCADLADWVISNIKNVGIFDCTMPGIAEGDCQDMVAVSTSLDAPAVKRIGDDDIARGNRQISPVRQALAKAAPSGWKLGSPNADQVARLATLLDTLVAWDSQGWFSNKYDYGSMHNVTVEAQSSDGSHVTLKGFYIFNGRTEGWVKVRIENGNLKCLQFHDIGDTCRDIRLPPPDEIEALAKKVSAARAKEEQRRAEQERLRKENSDRMARAQAEREARCPKEKTLPVYEYCLTACKRIGIQCLEQCKQQRLGDCY